MGVWGWSASVVARMPGTQASQLRTHVAVQHRLRLNCDTRPLLDLLSVLCDCQSGEGVLAIFLTVHRSSLHSSVVQSHLHKRHTHLIILGASQMGLCLETHPLHHARPPHYPGTSKMGKWSSQLKAHICKYNCNIYLTVTMLSNSFLILLHLEVLIFADIHSWNLEARTKVPMYTYLVVASGNRQSGLGPTARDIANAFHPYRNTKV